MRRACTKVLYSLLWMVITYASRIVGQTPVSVGGFHPAYPSDPFAGSHDEVVSLPSRLTSSPNATASVYVDCGGPPPGMALLGSKNPRVYVSVLTANAPLELIHHDPINVPTSIPEFTGDDYNIGFRSGSMSVGGGDSFAVATRLDGAPLFTLPPSVENSSRFYLSYSPADFRSHRFLSVRFSTTRSEVTLQVDLREPSVAHVVSVCLNRLDEVARKDAEERKRAEEEKARQAELEQRQREKAHELISHALSAMDAGQYDIAVAFYRQALGVYPDSADAKSGIQRAQQAAAAEAAIH